MKKCTALNLRVEGHIADELKEIARDYGMTFSEYMRFVLTWWLHATRGELPATNDLPKPRKKRGSK